MNILIVDDDAIDRKLAERIISQFGKVITTNDGFAAVDIYTKSMKTKERIDLICLEIDMPLINGIDTFKMFRIYEKINKAKPVKIIFVNREEEINSTESIPNEFQYDGFIQKPLVKEVFRKALVKFQMIDSESDIES